MTRPGVSSILNSAISVCRTCRPNAQIIRQSFRLQPRFFTTSQTRSDQLEIRAAPEIDLEKLDDVPARIIPASASYFTASPVFNDHLLLLQKLLKDNEHHPTLPDEQIIRMRWMTLAQYSSTTGERIPAAQYAKVLQALTRLNKIHPKMRSPVVRDVLQRLRRPGTTQIKTTQSTTFDEYGRSVGVGRRKESSAKVLLVEGTGEVLVNGKNAVQAFPRLHDRESALWPLKIAQRLDKYNVFALVSGGGTTGQAEAVTLALARALLVHEPALKPALRRAGCVTVDARQVERKKPGRVKARKMPTWVKR